MRAYVYLQPDSTFLLERWLGEYVFKGDSSSELRLVSESSEMAQLLAARYATLRVEPLEGIKPEPGARLVLPLPLESTPLHYQPPLQMPNLRPLFPLLRRLWLKGFRAFELYGIAGQLRFDIPHLLDEFSDRHKGQRCFIVGNGPSLNQIDMARLKDEITFGANRGYMGCKDWGLDFRYWGIYDPLQIEMYASEYEADAPKNIPKFFPAQYLPLLRLDGACPVVTDWPRGADREFSTDPSRLVVGYSVLFMLLQIAALMGCDPIYIVGLDHRYSLCKTGAFTRMSRLAGRAIARRYDDRPWYKAAAAAGREFTRGGEPCSGRVWNVGDATQPTHFTSAYTTQKQFLMPRPKDAERDYACAAKWARENGRTILNATPGTALKALPLVNYEDLF